MDRRHFSNQEIAEEEFKDSLELRRNVSERINEDPEHEVAIRNSFAKGCMQAANDSGEALRLAVNTASRVKHPKSSERVNSTRAGGSLLMICSALMARQGMDIIRGT